MPLFPGTRSCVFNPEGPERGPTGRYGLCLIPLHPYFFLKASRTSETGLEGYEAVNATGALDLNTQETKNQKQI